MKILVISDIHGNASALGAVLEVEQDTDHIIFLGDALLSGPQANETMTLLDGLHRIFGRDASPAARAVREAGMALLNAIPPLKQQVAGFAMGLHRK